MKKSVSIYLKSGIDPAKYGFAKTESGWWEWKASALRSGLLIEPASRKVSPYCGYCSANVAVIVRMAEDHALEIDESDDERPYIMRLTREEALAIEQMRGHPKEER